MSQQVSAQMIEVALDLGYTIEEIKCPGIGQIEGESLAFTKGMSQQEKDFYLNKKLNIYLGRRQKILRQVRDQIRRRQTKRKQIKQKDFNPKLMQIFNQFQKKYQKKKRYLQTRQRGLQSSNLRRKIKDKDNSFDFDRISKSRNKSVRNKVSSKSSIRSNFSNKSQFYEKGKDSQLKVSMVRQKQLKIAQYKKQILQQKLVQNHKKFLKAQSNILNKSRKLKIKSQISKMIVSQNKLRIQSQKKQHNASHLQNLKYKINRNQYVKSKLLTSNKHDKDQQIYYVQSVHNQVQRSKNSQLKSRYQQKIKMAEQRQNQYQKYRKFSIDMARQSKQKRFYEVRQKNQIKKRQANNYKHQMLIYQKNKFQQAQLQRRQQTNKKKLFTLDYKLQKEFVDRNRHSIELSRNIKNSIKSRQQQKRIVEQKQLQKLKKSLKKETKYFQKIIGARKAQTSQPNNKRIHFNSFNF